MLTTSNLIVRLADLAYRTVPEVIAENPRTSLTIPFQMHTGYAWALETFPPAHDPVTHTAVLDTPFQNEVGDWVQAWRIEALSDEVMAERLYTARAALHEAVTAKRWAVETGGITFPDGTRVSTGKDDQNRMISVVANAELAGLTEIDFKAASGWVTLTVEEIKGIAVAVALHVQACFAAEREHHAAIADLDAYALAAYDVNAGWPDA